MFLKELLPSVDRPYRGPSAAFWFLVVVTVSSTARSCVHLLAPDGGAGSIARIALDVAGGPNIVAVFSQWGASQLVLACVQWAVILRYRFLVPAMLALVAVEQLLRFAAGQLKPLQVESPPPGAYGTYIVFLLALIFLVLSLRQEQVQEEIQRPV